MVTRNEWLLLRKECIIRDGNRCNICKKDISTDVRSAEVHHTIPEANGGPNTLENLVTLCHNCHSNIHLNRDNNPMLRFSGKRNAGNRSEYRKELVNIYVSEKDYETFIKHRPTELKTTTRFIADILRKKAEFLRSTETTEGAPVIQQYERQ